MIALPAKGTPGVGKAIIFANNIQWFTMVKYIISKSMHKPVRNLTVFILMLVLYLPVNAQRPLRIELPARIDTRVYHLEPLHSQGFLLFYESNELNENGHRKWYFNLYDTQMKESWLQFVALADGMVFEQKRKTKNKVYFLFSIRNSKEAGQAGFQLLIYDIEKESFNLMSGSLPEKAEIAGFETGNHYALIAINLPRYQADILMLNLGNGTIKSVSLKVENQVILQQTAHDQHTGMFLVAAKLYQSNSFDSDLFLVLDSNGNEYFRKQYADEQQRFLHSYVLHLHKNNQLIAIGSYNDPVRRDRRIREGQPNAQNEASGFFFMKMTQDKEAEIAHFDFSSFNNIYSSLSVYDLMRARQRQARSRRKSDEVPINVAFQFYNPQLTQHNGQLIYSAEAYRPQYRTETRMDYDFYGRPIPYTYTIFEGYNFFNYLLAGFNIEGNLLWNNGFELRELLSPQLEQHVWAQADSTGIIMVYNTNGRITSKLIDEGEVIGKVEQIRNETFYPTDRIQEETFSRMVHWYDQYYLAFGYQQIANNRLTNNNLRTVFYINKLAFE